MEQRTLEQQVADVILQRDIAELVIDGKTYKIGQPSVATLIMVSEIVSTLPKVDSNTDKEQRFYSVLHIAKDFGRLGDIAATLILGARAIRNEQRRNKHWFSFLRKRRGSVQTLGEKILENITSEQLFNLLLTRFNGLDIGNFFAVTISLGEANILRRTREVENPTQSGQQS